MPYICADCGYVFEKPKKYTEKSPGEDIAFDEWYGCPDCGSDSYYTAHTCCNCGEYFWDGYKLKGTDEYVCADCLEMVDD